MGVPMLCRMATGIGLALALGACANELPTTAEFTSTSALSVTTRDQIRAGAGTGEAPSRAEMPKKTMADRVLTAIALERVTGLKPDPSRLTQ